MIDSNNSLIGVGLYSVPEAAALTGISTTNIRRWLFGYSSKHDGKTIEHPPLWQTQIHEDDHQGLGFHDLLELRFVDAFKKYGVSLQAIRAAAKYAKSAFESDHPFTCKQFRTDGRSIFAEVLDQAHDGDTPRLLDLVRRQYVFRRVISPSLYKGIDYDNLGEATRWRPNGSKYIALDPDRSFGKPIDIDSGVPTSVLYQAYLAEEDKRFVSKIYEVSLKSVEAAVEFEQRIAAGEIFH